MRINITLSKAALEETEIQIKNFLTSVHFKTDGEYMIIRAFTFEKVEITIKFRPGVEHNRIILQDATVKGALWLANLSESWILSKIDKSLEELSKKVAVHDFHIGNSKIYLSFSPLKND